MERTPKIIYTGISGLLGGYIRKKEYSAEITGIGNVNIKSDKKNFSIDITNRQLVLDLILKIRPEIIIHGAAIGNVDYCEKNPQQAIEVNVEGTENIIAAAKSVNARIIFLSSNAVYDGENPPYNEEAAVNPIDVYGKTKVEGEKLIVESGLDYCILRLMTMYGWPQIGGRSNPVTWVIDSLKRGERINVVNDIYNNHLWAGQAADAIWQVIEREKVKDVYNISGNECISRYDLALKVAEVFELDPTLITPVDSDFFKNLAKRPKNTCFNPSKMEGELGIKPLNIDEGLALMKQEQM